METRIARLESDIAHIKTDVANVQDSNPRHASMDSRIAKLADELSDVRVKVAGLKGTEKALLPLMAVSNALALLAFMIAVLSRHPESQPREVVTTPTAIERPSG
jgi:hypothetical protein